eukprot:TRINITY_DN1286_c0_g1_i2.p1 TRINITY_DN1286_c0_g1~~TRINITY_DN1286_c0_g1_i2.p1  ORF type:complete len:178 (+),score=42.51 TRINITY_DN1286_c0_g1_i2:160-693(+)
MCIRDSPNTIALQEEASNIWTAFTAQTNHELPAFLKSRPEMKLSGKPGLNLKTVLHRLKKQPQGFQCSTQNDFAQFYVNSVQLQQQDALLSSTRNARTHHRMPSSEETYGQHGSRKSPTPGSSEFRECSAGDDELAKVADGIRENQESRFVDRRDKIDTDEGNECCNMGNVKGCVLC